ncbi:MAG: 16S rRNA (cytosine(967)-C(5))-methyltransferase RsmB [Gammaproteobacteria bacterium]
MSARLIATRIIKRVVEDHQQLARALAEDKGFADAGQEKAWIQELCYGTLRWYLQLDYLLGLLLDKPVRKKDSDIKYLLLGGLYQLKFMQTPAYAVVSETVAVCKQLKKVSAKGLVNAVLRRYQREADNLESHLEKSLQVSSSHPQWLINRLQQDWPEHYLDLIEANNNKPPMYLRVNRLKTDRDTYLLTLQQADINAEPCAYSQAGIRLIRPCPVEQLPGFFEGLVSVQDLAAQLASHLLQLEPGQTVLDACAAPGGKSAALLETESGLNELVLVEKEPGRADKIRENFERLQLTASIRISDMLDLNNWWDGKEFDRILLDAPCSASGVIRRHSDIKLLRTEKQVDEVNLLQKQLLECAWSVLKPGGLLLYATCSVLKLENSDTIRAFLASQTAGKLLPIKAPWGLDTGFGTQILTGADGMDGFFYAVIKKQAGL